MAETDKPDTPGAERTADTGKRRTDTENTGSKERRKPERLLRQFYTIKNKKYGAEK
jgi:hypothetical protein